MSKESESAYFLRREQAARARAAEAADPHIARIHDALATQYAEAACNAEAIEARAARDAT